jgi:hypothetical protein
MIVLMMLNARDRSAREEGGGVVVVVAVLVGLRD